MTSGEDNERSSENQDSQEYNAASRTEEECLDDADAAAFNARMNEGSAAADDADYLDDTSFDAQLDRLDWESGEDPFETLPEMDIIRHNVFDI